MGRLKKYHTVEEKKIASKIASNKYYWKNKSVCDEKARIKYKNNGNSLSTQKKTR